MITGSFESYNSTKGMTNPKIFSANISTTSGNVTNNKGAIITSCTAANPTVCTFTGLTGEPNCIPGVYDTASYAVRIEAISSSSVTLYTYNTTTGGASGSVRTKILCHGE